MEHHEVAREITQSMGEVFQVIAPLREEDRRPLLLESPEDVVEDEVVAALIPGKRGVQFLNAGVIRKSRPLELRLPDDEPLAARPKGRPCSRDEYRRRGRSA